MVLFTSLASSFYPRLAAGVLGGASGLYVAQCSEKDPPTPPRYPWWFIPFSHGYDIPSVRRGYEVYRQVCATCHSLELMSYRRMVNTVYPERRVKEFAAMADVTDGPNDEGEMFQRPGNLLDHYPSPYPNEQAGRFANGGAYPPDLSQMAAAREGGADYLFSLLTGYRDPPQGIKLRAGLYYNTYFQGGAIGMPPPLVQGQVEYEDGTPATTSQMAKDVTQFLCWTQDPQHDERKLMGLKVTNAMVIWCLLSALWHRSVWIPLKTMRIDFAKTKY